MYSNGGGRAVYSYPERLQAGEGRGAVGARGEIGDLRSPFRQGGEQGVAMSDRLVTRYLHDTPDPARRGHGGR